MAADPELHGGLPYEQILKVFRDYADYDLGDTFNVARCRIYIKAGRMLSSPAIRRSSQATRAEEVELEPEIIERSVNKATAALRQYRALVAGPSQVLPDPDWREA